MSGNVRLEGIPPPVGIARKVLTNAVNINLQRK
jgi:hypothetical protein